MTQFCIRISASRDPGRNVRGTLTWTGIYEVDDVSYIVCRKTLQNRSRRLHRRTYWIERLPRAQEVTSYLQSRRGSVCRKLLLTEVGTNTSLEIRGINHRQCDSR